MIYKVIEIIEISQILKYKSQLIFLISVIKLSKLILILTKALQYDKILLLNLLLLIKFKKF